MSIGWNNFYHLKPKEYLQSKHLTKIWNGLGFKIYLNRYKDMNPVETAPVLGIFCMGLGSPAYYGGSHFFLFVVTVSFIGTIIWIFVYLLGIREALTFPLNWILTELVNTGICTVCYFIAFILQLIVSSSLHPGHPRKGAQIAAGVFGILNTLVYAFATYLLHVEWKGSRTSQ